MHRVFVNVLRSARGVVQKMIHAGVNRGLTVEQAIVNAMRFQEGPGRRNLHRRLERTDRPSGGYHSLQAAERAIRRVNRYSARLHRLGGDPMDRGAYPQWMLANAQQASGQR